MDHLLEVFDAWPHLLKARQALGLEKWEKLSYMADQLKGKKASDITFTTCYPGQEGQKKRLGSVEGNMHFLMGYANPAFHVAAYHWSVVDPNLSPEDALKLHHLKGHPSRVEFWEASGLEMTDEGDLLDGQPHSEVADIREMYRVAQARKAESITVTSGTGIYTAIPSEGIVYGVHNDHAYAWEMVRDSFFAAANEELAEKMNEAAAERELIEESLYKSRGSVVPISEQLKHVAHYYADEEFDSSVYPLVKSHFPVPGSIIPLASETTGESIYGIITKSSVDFYNRHGQPVNVAIFDLPVSSIDLNRDGNTYASVVKSLGTEYLNLPNLEEFVSEDE